MNQQKQYYHQRAKEYEQVYKKPERQEDLKKLHTYVQEQAVGKKIVEIACGTGYWTKTLAESGKTMHACDYNKAVLEIAKEKKYGTTPVTFQQIDVWKLQPPKTLYDLVFGGFIWSHILKERLPDFIKLLWKQVHKNGSLLMIDNRYVEGSSTPIARTDEMGNTYQMRRLANGDEFEVLKNFPEQKEVYGALKEMGLTIEWIDLEYYWVLKINEQIV